MPAIASSVSSRGVIEVRHQVDALLRRRVLPERRLQLFVAPDAPGVERRHLRADADDPHVLDAAQRLEDLDQPPGAHQQRVAAGQQDVGDLRVLGDVLQPGADVVGHLVVVVHEQPLAEAVAAVGAADLVAQQQHGVDILVLHAAGDRHRALVAGVEPAPVVQLLLAGDDQLLDRVVGIVPVDQVQVVVVGAEHVLLGHRLQPRELVRGDLGHLIESSDVLHPSLIRRGRHRGLAHVPASGRRLTSRRQHRPWRGSAVQRNLRSRTCSSPMLMARADSADAEPRAVSGTRPRRAGGPLGVKQYVPRRRCSASPGSTRPRQVRFAAARYRWRPARGRTLPVALVFPAEGRRQGIDVAEAVLAGTQQIPLVLLERRLFRGRPQHVGHQ